MKRLLRNLLRLLLLAAVLVAGGVLWLILGPGSRVPNVPAPDAFVFLDQGWGGAASAEPRQAFSFAPSGASLFDIRYDWLVSLEVPWGTARFASPGRMRAFGFVVDPEPTATNPRQLPSGFARRYDPALGEAVVDVSCAACHTGQLVVERAGRRTAVRIDGGSASHALGATRSGEFLASLTASLASTYLNPLKFGRFAHRVLGDRYESGKDKLHDDVGRALHTLLRELWRDRERRPEGPGRTDMMARMAHRAFGGASDASRADADAPVRYPSLWNAWKSTRARAAGSASQPMAVAISHALGSGASVALQDAYGRPVPREERYRSSVQVDSLQRVQTLLQRLSPPRWPEGVFGAIDRGKAERGRALFQEHCARCHGVIDLPPASAALERPLRAPGEPLWQSTVVPVSVVGTDAAAAAAAVERTVDLRPFGLTADDVRAAFRPAFEEYRRRLHDLSSPPGETTPSSEELAAARREAASALRERLHAAERLLDSVDVRRAPVTVALAALVATLRAHHDHEHGFTPEQRACLDGFGALELPEPALAYVARPLAGAWANGPFLHNGSVPTLYQLLSPQDERAQRFFVSPGAFDPVQVGLDTKERGDGFWFDTRLPGNANVGHEFRPGFVAGAAADDPQYGVIGPALSPDERWAIVEYLKVHRDPETPPGRVPPDCGLR